MQKILLIGLGGFLGSVARYYVSVFTVSIVGSKFPLGTLLVNICGSLIMGCLLGYSFYKNGLSDEIRMFVVIGLLGGFTTFSAFSAETIILISESKYIIAFINVLANLILSLSATAFGLWLIKP